MKREFITLCAVALTAVTLSAQKVAWYETTEKEPWVEKTVKMTAKSKETPLLAVDASTEGKRPFRAWGTTFNEQDWAAMNRLKPAEQEEIMRRLFAPDGDLRFTRGRISMNANDYALDWYSCDTVDGDFRLKYFNIEHDKATLIPLIRQAQKVYPQLTLWMSPWSPPAWMKINHDYPVLSSRFNKQPKEKDYLLYGAADEAVDPDEMKLLGDRNGVFPRRLATTDYFIQDPRYLQAYADMFCRFIELYAEENIPIDMVMYQNEAYSYTPYPGCAWTAEGTVRFNTQYLAPTLKRRHPDVKLYLGTFNTNRQDYIEKILAAPGMVDCVDGFGEQWECRDIVQHIIAKYPQLHYICSESECGNGSMDWKAGEHTFFLLTDNTGKGIDEYYNWNFILTDNGMSRWGWSQNALIQVDSKTNQYRYMAEYYAYKHFSHFVSPGSVMVGYKPRTADDNLMEVVFRTPEGSYVVVCGNFNDEPRVVTTKVAGKFLKATLKAHSFNTMVVTF